MLADYRKFLCLLYVCTVGLFGSKESIAQQSSSEADSGTRIISAQATAGTVLINEVVTDPQQDWSENSGGNSVPFDDKPGNGSITVTDEFVELFNSGSVAIDLTAGTGWVLEFNDTTPEMLNFTNLGSEVLTFSDGGSVSNFQPSEFLVIGNPPGAMNNDIFLVLKDNNGVVIDDVELGDDREGDGNGDGAADGSSNGGNATGIPDESISRTPNGTDTDNDINDFSQQEASPTKVNSFLKLIDHPTGQVNNAFITTGSVTDVELHAFRLAAIGEAVDVTSVVFDLSNINGLVTGDLSGLEIRVDSNGDGSIDGTETTAVGGTGVANITGVNGTITFNTQFTQAVDSTNYILIGDISVDALDRVDIGLTTTTTITAQGASSGLTITPTGTVSQIAVHNAEATLNISAGVNNPGDSYELSNEQGLEMLAISLTASIENIDVSSMTFTADGTADDVNDIASAASNGVRLFEDDGNGIFDGTETQIGSSQAYNADNGTVTFAALTETIEVGTPENWLLVYNLSTTSASPGETFTAKLNAASDVTATGATSSQSITPTGTFPITGGTKTIVPIVINEVVTDPQTDWSTNDFDGTDGGGTISQGVDEFVEIFIKAAGLDLTNWTIELLNGTDVMGDLTGSGAFQVSNYVGGGSFTNTQAGDFLVLGNVAGAGQMSNDIFVVLKDNKGIVVDDVELGDDFESDGNGDGAADGSSNGGNATGISDESISRTPNGTDTDNDINDFSQQEASPTKVNSFLKLLDHPAGQIENAFNGTGTLTDLELFAFRLKAIGEAVDVTSVVFDLSNINGLVTGELSGLEIRVDSNGDGNIDGTETTAVGGAGVANITGATGTITFNTQFTQAVDSTDYILIGDISVDALDRVDISLTTTTTITAQGASSGLTITPTGAVSQTAVHNAEATLNISAGVNNPRDSYELSNEQGLEMLAISLTASIENIDISSMTFTADGTADDVNDIASAASNGIRLFEDDGNGIFDGTERQIGSSQAYNADNGTVTFAALTETIEVGTPENWLLVYNLSSTSASPGETFIAKLNAASDVTGTGATSSQSITPTGTFPITGGTKTIVPVVINEVVTDPQTDWSTNGFDGTDGGGTISQGVDEFVELFIKADGLDLTNWTIELLNGTDVMGDLTGSGAFQVSNYVGSGSFTNTQTGDFLVLGNVAGAGQMSNDIFVVLKDNNGIVVDDVELGDDFESDGNGDGAPDGSSNGGNATGIPDESISRTPNGTDTDNDINDFSQQEASPTKVNSFLKLIDHPAGQVDNAFITTGSVTDVELHAFRLAAIGEAVDVTSVVFDLSNINGLVTGDLSGLEIRVDSNGDGSIDGTETTAVGGAGVANITGATGTITFSAQFAQAVDSTDYILIGDISIDAQDRMDIDLTTTTTITAQGASSGLTITPTGAVSQTGMHNAVPRLTIELGSNNLPLSYEMSDVQDLEMLQLALTAGGLEDIDVSSITLTASGTADDIADITDVELWIDNNNDGILDDPGDSQINGGLAFSVDNGTATFSGLTEVINAGTIEHWLVVYDLSSTSASPGETFIVSINSSSDITATGAVSSQSVSPTGIFPISGNTKTIVPIVINEIVTDPQQDWNDTSGGNGIPFDSTAGNGTISSTDEWLELFNKSSVSIDLAEGSGWTLEFVNGTNATLNFASPGSEVFVFSDGGSLSNFQAGEYLVIGNPPGVLNNDVYVVLRDSAGAVVDDVELGDDFEGDGDGDGAPDGSGNGGNAKSTLDEAVARAPNGVDTDNDVNDFSQLPATIGSNNNAAIKPDITVTPSAINFGDVQVGVSSGNKIIIIRNDGTGDLTVSSITSPSSPFNLSGVPIFPIVISGGSSVSINAAFSPTSTNTFSSTITINSDDPDEANVTVSLIGSGVPPPEPEITVIPSSLELGNVLIGSSSTRTIAIQNDGPGDLIVGGIAISGLPFTLRDLPSLPTTIASNGSVTLGVVFSPLTAEMFNGTVTINSNDDDEATVLVSLTGAGISLDSVDVVINEIVTDPQQDWNDSSGGNGVPFDSTSGNGTISSTDEWIELFNKSSIAINLTGFLLEFIDTTPETLDFATPTPRSVVFAFSDGGSLTNFQPGEFLVIGNPPGVVNNDIFIKLETNNGTLIDDVELGDDFENDGDGDGAPDGTGNGGNAAGISDEAVARVPNGSDTDDDITDFFQQAATIGAENGGQLADLAVSKIVSEQQPDEGDIIEYTVEVSNNGPDAATGVQIIDKLPAGVTFVSSATTLGSYNNATGIWDMDSLAQNTGATLSLTVTVDVGAGGTTLTNTASISKIKKQADPNEFNNIDSVGIQIKNPPKAVNDQVTTNEDTPVIIDVLANDHAPEGSTLSVLSVTQGENGSVVKNNNGTVTYSPNPDYYGSDSFAYVIGNGPVKTDTAQVAVTIAPVNDPPVAVSDTVSASEDMPINIAVLANDVDMDGDTLIVTAITQPTHGVVEMDSNYTVAYVPNQNFTGTDSFIYTIDDQHNGAATGVVTVLVDNMNDAPALFTRITPPDNSVMQAHGLTFMWTQAQDVDGDTVHYTLSIAVDGIDTSFVMQDTSLTVDFRTLDLNNGQLSVNWSVLASDGNLTSEPANGPGLFMLQVVTSVSSSQESDLPTEFALHANYPNPFNPTTTLRYDMPERAKIRLEIYNLIGQKVRTLVNEEQSAGVKTLQWDGKNNFGAQVTSGVYFVRFQATGTNLQPFVLTRKVTLLK